MTVFRVGHFNHDHVFDTRKDGVSFSPSDISGLQLWLDADDSSTITKDVSDKVSIWADKSPQSNNIIQNTQVWKPVWLASQFGSKPAINFNQHHMNTPGVLTFTASNEITWFIVVKDTTFTVGGGDLFNWRTTPGNIGGLAFEYLDSTTIYAYVYTTGWNFIASTYNLNTALFTASIQATNYSFWKDGVLAGSSLGVGNFNVPSAEFRMGRNILNSSLFSDFSCAEFIMYDSGLSTADRQRVENYLNTKWGL